MSELFHESEVAKESPRLLWLRQHDLALGQLPSGTRFCAHALAIFTADTHKDCELKMATYLGTEHWELTEFKKAGVKMPEAVECWE